MKRQLLLNKQKRFTEVLNYFQNRISEGSLRERVSRTSLREAIKILEALGCIDIRRGKGMFIRKPNTTTAINPLVYGLLLSDLDISVRVEFRRHFEHLVVEIARKKSTPHLLDALKAIVAKEQDAVGADDAVWTVYALYKRAMMYLAHVGNRAATIDTHNLYIHALESGNDKDLKALRRKIGGNYAPLSERK